jgi:hypothetical protein
LCWLQQPVLSRRISIIERWSQKQMPRKGSTKRGTRAQSVARSDASSALDPAPTTPSMQVEESNHCHCATQAVCIKSSHTQHQPLVNHLVLEEQRCSCCIARVHRGSAVIASARSTSYGRRGHWPCMPAQALAAQLMGDISSSHPWCRNAATLTHTHIM